MKCIHNFFDNCENDCKLFSLVKTMNEHKQELKEFVMLMNQDKLKTKVVEEVKRPGGNYYRHIMFRNEQYEIIIIVWDPKSSSPIHDHPEFGCCMFLCEGGVKEVKYVVDDNDHVKEVSYKTLRGGDDTTYIDNSIGFHCIENHGVIPAISVHVYSPPLHVAKTLA